MAGGTAALGGGSGGDWFNKALKQYQPANPGVAAGNPQASPAPGTPSPQMQLLGGIGQQMGNQMMQAGQHPAMQAPPMMRPPVQPAQPMAQMPQPLGLGSQAPWMQQQINPQMMNQLLSRQLGLMGQNGRPF